jgi:hypothetical protein
MSIPRAWKEKSKRWEGYWNSFEGGWLPQGRCKGSPRAIFWRYNKVVGVLEQLSSSVIDYWKREKDAKLTACLDTPNKKAYAKEQLAIRLAEARIKLARLEQSLGDVVSEPPKEVNGVTSNTSNYSGDSNTSSKECLVSLQVAMPMIWYWCNKCLPWVINQVSFDTQWAGKFCQELLLSQLSWYNEWMHCSLRWVALSYLYSISKWSDSRKIILFWPLPMLCTQHPGYLWC